MPFSLVILHFHTAAKHLYRVSGCSHSDPHVSRDAGQMNSKRDRVSPTTWSQSRRHANVHRARAALQQRAKEAPVCSLSEGARYRHEESWPGEGAGDGMWKLTAKTSLSVKSYDFWLCSLDQRERGSSVLQRKEWGWEGEGEGKEKGSSIKCIS